MADIASKFGLGGSSGGGINFTDAWQFYPYIVTTTDLEVSDSSGAGQDSTTTAFFTQYATMGLQDTTDWVADTYKTILNVASGKGLVASIVGPTAGGASTTTFEFTNDAGVVEEMVIAGLASGERAVLYAVPPTFTNIYTSAGQPTRPYNEVLEADKATFGAMSSTAMRALPWRQLGMFGAPLYQFNTSLLLRAKHSADITNSTATAYSAVQYRLGL